MTYSFSNLRRSLFRLLGAPKSEYRLSSCHRKGVALNTSESRMPARIDIEKVLREALLVVLSWPSMVRNCRSSSSGIAPPLKLNLK
jgi:hypothetical protein